MMKTKSKKYIVINWENNDIKWGTEKQFQKWKNKTNKEVLDIIKSEYDEDEGITLENVGMGYTKRKVGCGFEHYNDDGDGGNNGEESYLELT